jgi:hypothetical protein
MDKPFVKDEPKNVTAGYGIAKDVVCKRLFNFDTGKHDLKPEHRATIKGEILGALMSNSLNRVYLVGHASRRGPAELNMALSERRALAVKDVLDGSAGPGRVWVGHKGATATLGKDENDPVDRAVVVIVQSVELPLPPVIKDGPKGALPAAFDEPWFIQSVSGVSAGAPWGGATVGLGAQSLTLERRVAKTVARYTIGGLMVGVGPDLKNLPVLGPLFKSTKGFTGSVGPLTAPTWGSQVVMRPLFKKPVEASDLAGWVTITSASAALGPGWSGSLIIFSTAPLTALPIGAWNIKGAGLYTGPTLSLGLGTDTLHGYATLTSVQ